MVDTHRTAVSGDKHNPTQNDWLRMIALGDKPASGVAPISGSFGATGVSSSLAAPAGRGFNIHIGTVGTPFGGTVELWRKLPGETNFDAVTYPDGTKVSWTSGVNTSWEDTEAGALYELNCTAWTAAISYRLSA